MSDDDKELCSVCFKDRTGNKLRSMSMDLSRRLINGPPLTLEERVFQTRPFCSYDCFRKAQVITPT